MNFSRINQILNWSKRIGSLFGIPIYLHISLLFFLWPILGSLHYRPGIVLEYSAAVVFGILLHELGHALTARHFRQTDISITLHGFGGYAMSTGRRTPMQELWIVLAGPAVTFLFGFLCLGVAAFRESATGAAQEQLYLFYSLGRLEILIGFLNLIPSLPFDGGLALRAILWRRLVLFKATRRVAHVGLIVSPILLVYGFVTKHDLLLFFGLLGSMASWMTLQQTGGVRFNEAREDRQAAKELEAVKARERERNEQFLDEVAKRRREREEMERLRRLIEGPDKR